MDEKILFRVIEQIDEVLTKNHVSTHMVLTVGFQLIKSAFTQVVSDSPTADMITLADSITETLNKSLKQTIWHHDSNSKTLN